MHVIALGIPVLRKAMSPLFRNSPNAYRMLQRMHPEISATFSAIQIQAIEIALVPRTHVIDIRVALPLLGKGAYLVFLAGPNKRTGDRTQPEKKLSMRDPSTVPTALANAINASHAIRSNPNAHRVLKRMPQEISASFNPTQIRAIEAALIPRSHVVDIRLSLPFLGKGAYLVFAAGPNRRAHYNNLQNGNPFVMPAVAASILVGAMSILGLVYLKGSKLLEEPDPVFAQGEEFHPTVVPFKKTKEQCEESDRQWINNQCIDTIHDPTF